MTTDRADDLAMPSGHGTESLDEQARRKGIRPLQSADDLAHWCTILRLVIFDGSLMHPWCRQATALLA